ncbi:MAG TPA: site-2 protease family protein, partial [Myxococcaceae bacterium]|nr:site-2 protease family protein [Myxococcaceae bacterium]
MLRFRLGPIPVEVHYSHFLVAALLGLNLVGGVPPNEAITTLAIWMAVVFVSVLTHELGHALVSLAYGYRPRIQLVWTGGLTHPDAPGPIPWHRDILLTLAGPAFGLALYGVARAISSAVQPDGAARDALRFLLYANWAWSVLNLLPILPLDGGRIVQAALMRAFRKRGFLFAQLISVVTAVLLGIVLLESGQQLLLLYLAFFAVRAVQQIAEYFRGQVPAGADPSAAALNDARTRFRDGDVEGAQTIAEQILASNDVGPRSRSAAHHLLGW